MNVIQRDPRKTELFWAHTQAHAEHWRINETAGGLDILYKGKPYDYPLGIAYLLRSALSFYSRLSTDRLGLSSQLTTHLAGLPLPTHIPYPFDDVLVGSWINDHAPDTIVVHDPAGFHNPEKDWAIVPIDWDTVCVHQSEPVEMRALRRRKEYADEFTK
jgi:hypothetical protein